MKNVEAQLATNANKIQQRVNDSIYEVKNGHANLRIMLLQQTLPYISQKADARSSPST